MAHNIRTICKKPIPEHSAFEYGATLTKQDGTPFLPSEFSALTLTVYNLDATETLINGLDAVDILNAGRGTLDASGRLTVLLEANDLALVDDALPHERHIMLIEGLYAAGALALRKEVEHVVINMSRVP